MRTTVGIALVGTVACGLGIQLAQARAQQKELSLLREDLVRVSKAVERLESTANTAPRHGGIEPPASARAAPSDFDSAAMRAHLESVFSAQATDRDWAAESTRLVRTRLSVDLPNSTEVRGLECHSSLCRLEIAYSDEAMSHGALTELGPTKRWWNGPSIVQTTRDSSAKTTTLIAYLIRPGFPVPVPPLEEERGTTPPP
ncbi:hypothetical protein KRR26_34305 [Corallococcus sp. M34]|uniref:hypothetical protein n=1 Tax=Citreicoccus inhibens TaxID=2849499 RepID=UPI001C20FCAD|nr:hypothetical protein [Citreicoccus inhibens]MBU8900694.1 hypothetical protein [Citreicoccus inhibens]